MLNILKKLTARHPKCSYQESKVNCPFVQDAQNPHNYICQECGLQCSADRVKIGEIIWWVIRGIALLYTLID